MGGACSAGQFQTPFGIVQQRRSNQNKSTVPHGAQSCMCPPKHPAGVFREVLEFVETESKGVVEYNFARKKSGWTVGIAKFVRIWYHCNYADIPKSLRKLKPPRDAEQWIWSEVWHMSKWIVYSDPYTHQRYRFRMWRRAQVAPGDWTEDKNKPPEEEQKTAEEEKQEDKTGKGNNTDETIEQQISGETIQTKFGSEMTPEQRPVALPATRPSVAMPPMAVLTRPSINSIPSPPLSPLAPLMLVPLRKPTAPTSPHPMDILATPVAPRVAVPPSTANIAKADSMTRDPDSPTG